MAIIAGIDEAGYGPLLGPLVVSQVAFEVPDEKSDQCLWTLLEESVTNKISRRDTRLPIVDSKKLHRSQKGLSAIEGTSLTMLAAGGQVPTDIGQLLQILCPKLVNILPSYPWYRDFRDRLPIACDAKAIAVRANSASRNLQENNSRFLEARCCILPEGHFNRLVNTTRNKAVVVWTLTLKLIHNLLQRAGGQKLIIRIDRQGGRTNYTQPLLTAFEGVQLKVLAESDALSRYLLQFERQVLLIEFRQSGEAHHLPIALASIYSKYLRELFMVAFNRYWQQKVSPLKRTAGYYQDGLRFLKDIEPAMRTMSVDRRMLVRSR